MSISRHIEIFTSNNKLLPAIIVSSVTASYLIYEQEYHVKWQHSTDESPSVYTWYHCQVYRTHQAITVSHSANILLHFPSFPGLWALPCCKKGKYFFAYCLGSSVFTWTQSRLNMFWQNSIQNKEKRGPFYIKIFIPFPQVAGITCNGKKLNNHCL